MFTALSSEGHPRQTSLYHSIRPDLAVKLHDPPLFVYLTSMLEGASRHRARGRFICYRNLSPRITHFAHLRPLALTQTPQDWQRDLRVR